MTVAVDDHGHWIGVSRIIVNNPVNRILSAVMPSRRDYDDIPGTIVFDGRQSRRGYALNKFLMSLNQAANREAFKADEAGYLDRFRLDAEQREAVLGRQWLRLLEVGGNVYYTYKLAACDGMTFQDLAGAQTGMTREEFAEMMLSGGRSPHEGR
jgi:protocatechuate 4,5-dioxygenase alpha chain